MKVNYTIIEQQLQDLVAARLVTAWEEKAPGQYRIDESLDLYPRHQKYHSLRTGKRGKYWNLKEFVGGFFHPELRDNNQPKVYA